MLWRLQVLGATARFSAKVCFRKTSVALQISGLGLISVQILKAGRLGTDFNLSFWISLCKKQPQIGKTQVKYIFLILFHLSVTRTKYIIGKLNLSAILRFRPFFCTYYICKAISESLAISHQLSTEGWSWDFVFFVTWNCRL